MSKKRMTVSVLNVETLGSLLGPWLRRLDKYLDYDSFFFFDNVFSELIFDAFLCNTRLFAVHYATGALDNERSF